MTALDSYAPLWPEIVLAAGAMALLMYGAFRLDKEREGETAGWLAIGLLALSTFLVLRQPSGAAALFDGAFVIDDFGRFMKLLVLAGSAAALLMAFDEFNELIGVENKYALAERYGVK